MFSSPKYNPIFKETYLNVYMNKQERLRERERERCKKSESTAKEKLLITQLVCSKTCYRRTHSMLFVPFYMNLIKVETSYLYFNRKLRYICN